MRISIIAKRYANSLFIVSKQKNEVKKTLSEIKKVVEIFDRATVEFFKNPLISVYDKMKVSENSFSNKGLANELYNLFLLLTEKNRMHFFPEIVEAFQQRSDEDEGITRGTVYSARSVNEDTRMELENKISSAVGKKIILKYMEDPSVLGGMVVKAGGWTFDESIESHLKILNEQLNRSSN